MKRNYFKRISQRINSKWRRSFTLLLLLVCSSIFFIKCNKEELKSNATNEIQVPISTRTCEPGDATVFNDRIVFDDFDEFYQTLDFIKCASDQDIDDWLDSLGATTAGKAYRTFENLISSDEVSDGDFEDALEEYDGKISVSTNTDGDYETKSLFSICPLFRDILNMDGEFQIDTTYVKVAGSHLIFLTRPSLVDISEIDEETETDTANGIHVQYLNREIESCCPDSKHNVNRYQTNHRLTIDYNANVYIFDPDGPYDVRHPIIDVWSDGHSEKRKGALGIIHWWVCENKPLRHQGHIFLEHTIDPDWRIKTPLLWSWDEPHSWECKPKWRAGAAGQLDPFADQSLDYTYCITSAAASLTITGVTPAISVSVSCN